MPLRGHKYYPSSLPSIGRDEETRDYLSRLTSWMSKEYEDIHKDMVQSADVNVETTPTRLPYDGMLRYFIHDTGGTGYGWSPGDQGTGLYLYVGGSWYRLSLTFAANQ
jgi:hypothetical protein